MKNVAANDLVRGVTHNYKLSMMQGLKVMKWEAFENFLWAPYPRDILEV
jgi:hypothetical protein